MVCYRKLQPDEINLELFHAFQRRQIVTKCWRKEERQWVIKDIPFIDDWKAHELEELVCSLKHTTVSGGLVYGAFISGSLKGFLSVEGTPIGSRRQYMDLSNIHVSQDVRGQGIGRELFLAARQFAKERNGEKLYISAHSAVESQAFYRAMGCVEAEEYNQEHVEKEPYDCQMECAV